jgi:hypothetical protein
MTPTITTWSYSAYKEYCQCPFKSKLKRIDKLKEPGSPAMDRGTAIHQIAQDYVEGKRQTLHEGENNIGIFQKQFQMLKDMKAVCELEWGFTRTWKATGFFSKDVWLRVKTDATFKSAPKALTIVDHKTGRIYEDHRDQLNLYAVGGFILNPEVDTITAQDWYLDQDAVTEETFHRKDFLALLKGWEDRVMPMMRDTLFPKRPGPLCRFCHFRKNNGGPCNF